LTFVLLDTLIVIIVIGAYIFDIISLGVDGV